MALTNVAPLIPSPRCFPSRSSNHSNGASSQSEDCTRGFGSETAFSKSKVGFYSSKAGVWACLGKRWRLNAVDTRIAENAPQSRLAAVDIPVTCYQLIGVSNQAEKDEVVKSVMNLKRAEIDEGYTMDAVMCRQELLMDVRDKLLFESEYAGNMKEKIPPKSSLRIPWSWLPSALCLLQEVGEEKLVLEIGRAAVQHSDAKPYIHDLLLSMALAECAIAKIGFEKNKVSEGFEALARAQCLLRSTTSLRQLTLVTQIEESLEELAPACTLELLGMPHSPENAERRRGAIAALQELLRQGLDVESSCQVQDWPYFLSQALNRLMASEIIDILLWNDLAIARKNKKSLESQNQRVVIDFNCFYKALIAHIAIGFSTKQTELINKAKTISECLIASEGVDLKLEEAFCLFLLGQGSESEAIEKLKQLESNSNPSTHNSISGKGVKDTPNASPSLEMWLKDAVLSVFPDTRDCSPSLGNFFRGERKALAIKQSKVAPQTLPNINHRSISTTLASERGDFNDSHSHINSSRHLGSAVKQLAPTDLQSPLIMAKSSTVGNSNSPSAPFKRSLGVNQNKVWESWLSQRNLGERITIAVVFGCITFITFKLWSMNLSKVRSASIWASSNPHVQTSIDWKGDSSLDYKVGPAHIKGTGFRSRINNALELVKMQFWKHSDTENLQGSCVPGSLSTSMTVVDRKPMPLEEAEALVKQWQAIKAEALGPTHQVDSLSEALDESMLFQWQALADAAKARCCYWRFVLLQLAIMRADILSDEIDGEMAEIEALLEEAAELVDESLQKNPNYYSTYKIRYVLKRQDDGSWRFCGGEILTST